MNLKKCGVQQTYKMLLISRRYLLLLTTAFLMLMLIPGSGLAAHVSVGRWTADDCFLGEVLEIFQENERYAISIKGKNVKQVLRPVKAKPVEADGTLVFEDTIESKKILYKIHKNKQLGVYLEGEQACMCRHKLVKQGSLLNRH
jgi:hypothetical protein